MCHFIHGDYMQIPEGDNRYDAAFAIESMPHAPDKTAAFREILRVLRREPVCRAMIGALRKGSIPDAEHLRIKADIARGDALPEIASIEVCDALRAAGSSFWIPGTAPTSRIRKCPGTGPCRAATSPFLVFRARLSAGP